LTALVSGPGYGPRSLTVSVRAPAFPDRLPLTRTPAFQQVKVMEDIRSILASGVLTNGPYVRQLEEHAAAYLDVAECVAVSSSTTGLMLTLQAAGLACEVVVPAFGFGAVARAAAWNGLQMSLADIDPHTLTLDPRDAADAIGIRTSALLAVHTFGTPADVDALAELANSSGIALLFDAADAFGSRHHGVALGGYGEAAVFSLSPTRVLIGCEGGLIATADPQLAERCRLGRDDSSPSDYDTWFTGLDARMSEVHAAVALASLENVEERVNLNNQLVAAYRRLLDGVEGIELPEVRDGDRSTCNGLTVLVDPDGFGMDAAHLAAILAAQGIESRCYGRAVTPAGRPLGRARALPIAPAVASRALTLPLWPELTEDALARVVEVIADARTSLSVGRAAFASA
jgi:dTDP-4-amino-4,6-dideoxygalactose transaminase